MDIPVKSTIEGTNRNLVHESVPKGGRKRNFSKSTIWSKKAQSRDRSWGRCSNTIVFDMQGECKGPLGDVMALGLQIAHELADEGDYEQAKAVVVRVTELPKEYEIRKQIRSAKALRTQLLKEVG